MRIEIKTSAGDHGITNSEIRTVISYPALQVPLVARRPGAELMLFAAPAAANEPYIEVIADLADTGVAIVFHAMMLRRQLVVSLGLAALLPTDIFGPQRPQRK
ncbi:RelE-like toxin [Gordonia phage Ruthy]|uniref:RelE-like toxin n=1 Tax=Gordonia phage Ruthy TaxID=2250323 RepID=A0A345L5E7_9CAUD|nr:RelE-like toxin [Gordonia phage Ruthy]AXH50499.1 RelE-like toxin [Gordonia phage Ruthy]